MTMLELLISASLLLVLTTMVMLVLVPMLNRSAGMDRKQENLQRATLFQDLLIQHLADAKLEQVTATNVTFYRPEKVHTTVGSLSLLNDKEAIIWDLYNQHTLEASTQPNQDVVLQIRTEGPAAGRRVLWNLGQGGTFAVDYSKKPLLRLSVTSIADLEPGTPPFERQFFVVKEE